METTSGEEERAIPEFGTRLEGIDYIARPGVYAVIENNDQQIALIKTSNGYFLPGGGMDSGETEVDALRREIREEIGYEISVGAKLGEAIEYIQAYREDRHYRIRSSFYKVQLESKMGEGIEKDHWLVWHGHEESLKLLVRHSQIWVIQHMEEGN